MQNGGKLNQPSIAAGLRSYKRESVRSRRGKDVLMAERKVNGRLGLYTVSWVAMGIV